MRYDITKAGGDDVAVVPIPNDWYDMFSILQIVVLTNYTRLQVQRRGQEGLTPPRHVKQC